MGKYAILMNKNWNRKSDELVVKSQIPCGHDLIEVLAATKGRAPWSHWILQPTYLQNRIKSLRGVHWRRFPTSCVSAEARRRPGKRSLQQEKTLLQVCAAERWRAAGVSCGKGFGTGRAPHLCLQPRPEGDVESVGVGCGDGRGYETPGKLAFSHRSLLFAIFYPPTLNFLQSLSDTLFYKVCFEPQYWSSGVETQIMLHVSIFLIELNEYIIKTYSKH